MLEAESFSSAVVLVNITPVSRKAANQVGQRIVARCLESFENTRRRHDPAGTEFDPAHFTTLMMPWFRLYAI